MKPFETGPWIKVSTSSIHLTCLDSVGSVRSTQDQRSGAPPARLPLASPGLKGQGGGEREAQPSSDPEDLGAAGSAAAGVWAGVNGKHCGD